MSDYESFGKPIEGGTPNESWTAWSSLAEVSGDSIDDSEEIPQPEALKEAMAEITGDSDQGIAQTEQAETSAAEKPKLPFEVMGAVPDYLASVMDQINQSSLSEQSKSAAQSLLMDMAKTAQEMAESFVTETGQEAARRMGIRAPYGALQNPYTAERTAKALAMYADGATESEVRTMLSTEFGTEDEKSEHLNQDVLNAIKDAQKR